MHYRVEAVRAQRSSVRAKEGVNPALTGLFAIYGVPTATHTEIRLQNCLLVTGMITYLDSYFSLNAYMRKNMCDT